MSSKARIVKSPKKFKIDRETKDTGMKEGREMTSLELLKNVSEYERVTVKGKIIEVSPVEKITVKSSGKNLMKKDFVLADLTSLSRCVAWKQNSTWKRVGKMKVIG